VEKELPDLGPINPPTVISGPAPAFFWPHVHFKHPHDTKPPRIIIESEGMTR